MTASGESNAGLHKRWLERKLDIEVGKVQAKLLSKGLNVPVPDPEALEIEARLAQSHLPKLCIELYGRNPNGTLKLSPDSKRSGPLPPATVVQKLDRMLNPALLTPIPVDVAMAHGLPLSCCDSGDFLTSSGMLTSRGGGGGGGGGRGSTSHMKQGAGGSGQTAHGGLTESGSSPRVSRSPPLQSHCRPDLQAVDLRIDDAVAEVHRVALQANEMSPRERVLYLARQVNPHFYLPQPQPRGVHLAASGSSRKEVMVRKCVSRRVPGFIPEPSAEAGGAGGRPNRVQGGASRRSMACVESRRSRDTSTSLLSSPPSGGSGGGSLAPVGEGSLPPLASRSRSVSRVSSSSHEAVLVASEHAAAATAITAAASAAAAVAAPSVELSDFMDALPRLSPSVSPVPSTPPGGESEEHGALPKLPPVYSGSEASNAGRASLTSVKPEISMWGAAAIVHAAEVAAARAAAEAEAEAIAEAEAEAAAAAAEAQAEAAAAEAEAALEAEVEAEARAAAGLLSQTPAGTAGGASPPAAVLSNCQQIKHFGECLGASKGETNGLPGAPHGELHRGGSHTGSSGWVP